MTDDPLESFGEEEEDGPEENDVRQRLTLLLFEYDSQLFALDAFIVDAVIPWRKPAPLPTSSTSFAGVVQDRGRIVGVVRHPLFGAAVESVVPKRVLVCRTPSGLLGIPATETLGVSDVHFAHEVVAGEVADSSAGALTLIDPLLLLSANSSGAPASHAE